ncbi:MAG: acetyltransferase [Chitinophagaceae bacterium]|nr:acetyltransferase [Chitinophagaceae bacterium]
MKRLAIIGSGDLGHQMAHHAIKDNHYHVAGFFDDYCPSGINKNGYLVLGGVKDVFDVFDKEVFDVLMIAIGYNHFAVRAQLFKKFYSIIPFGTIIHSSSIIDRSVTIEEGSFIYPGCIVDYNSVIKYNVILNVGCVIAHDSKIGDHTFLSPAVTIAGFVNVGSCVNLGIGTTVIDNITIADNVRTGGGAVVTQDLSERGLYVGVPAKLKKRYDPFQ